MLPVLQPKDDEHGWRLLSILITWLSLVGGAVHRQNASSLKASTIKVKAQVRSEPGRTWRPARLACVPHPRCAAAGKLSPEHIPPDCILCRHAQCGPACTWHGPQPCLSS